MPFALVSALSLVLAGLCLASLAIRYEYLVVLRWPRAGTMFFERRGKGKYSSVAPVLVPLALLRFAAHALSRIPLAARRAVSRALSSLPLPVSGKA